MQNLIYLFYQDLHNNHLMHYVLMIDLAHDQIILSSSNQNLQHHHLYVAYMVFLHMVLFLDLQEINVYHLIFAMLQMNVI
mmetsp:Transcript_123221/g.299304  ORF Transcript_123221/g.299304 Transcript_123221/m.299304 type:complete len:80 (+) Transcript_123221:163-402(+)